MRYRQQGPNNLLVTLIAAGLVFGGYFLYTGAVNWLEADSIAQQTATQEAAITQTEQSIVDATLSFAPFPTNTRVPNCEAYIVNVSSAFVRQCPSLTCPQKDRKPNQATVCVLGRPNPAEFDIYDNVDEWYIIDLNDGLVFPDLGYMHESVIEPRNPTPRPSQTFTPLPTITPFPTPDVPSVTPLPGQTATPTPEGVIEF